MLKIGDNVIVNWNGASGFVSKVDGENVLVIDHYTDSASHHKLEELSRL